MFNAPSDPGSWLLQILAVVRLRPGSFLGDEEVRTLWAFVHGYEASREDMGLVGISREDRALLDGFTAWLNARFGESTMGWDWIVQEQYREGPGVGGVRGARSATDGSIRLFFDLFEEFLSSINLRLPNGTQV